MLYLTCWIDDLELDRLIALFEETHPGVTIEVRSYYDDSADVETAMSRMNAELATGGDMDLYYLEGAMDVMTLVNAGLLADLYPLMESDESFSAELYYENVWNAMALDGALYEIPAGFQVSAIVGPESLLGDRAGWTIEEYQAFVAELDEPETFLPKSRSFMLYYMMTYAMFDYIDIEAGTCNFDSASFATWLEFINSFPENVDDTVAAEAQAYALLLSGIYTYLQYRDECGNALQFVGFPCDSRTEPCIEALTSFGISSQTDETELCWEFIKTLLSQEYQETIASDSFPILKSVFEAQLTAGMLSADDENALVNGSSLLGPLTVEETDKLRELVENLSVIRFRYRDVTDIVEEEADNFFSSDKNAEDVAKVIQSRVQIYLSEKN